MPPTKIRAADALAGECRRWRAEGRRIAFANGCFDLLHVGHVRYLEGARALGDVLIVAVNDDASVRRLKGEGRPLTPLAERLEILSHLDVVDRLVAFGGPTCTELLLLLRPHVQVKGTDYTPDSVPEADAVRSYGGTTAVAGDPKGHSTTELLEKMRRP
jgi:rfaE bifunctional protein nucleotidyltransferase chain/domain